jgi:hypothetical protein
LRSPPITLDRTPGWTAATICYKSASAAFRAIVAGIFQRREGASMGKSKDKDTKKMVKKEPTRTPKEKKEAKKLKKLERQRG